MMDDLFGARKARDDALSRVMANAGSVWNMKALAMIPALRPFEGTGEDIKFRLQRNGLEQPHHYNAWGAMLKKAVERGLIVHTGKSRQTISKRAHARVAKVYYIR